MSTSLKELRLKFLSATADNNAIISPEGENKGTYFTIIGCGDDAEQNALAELVVAAVNAKADVAPVAYLRPGEYVPIQNAPFGAMWISDKDDPRAFPVYASPTHAQPVDDEPTEFGEPKPKYLVGQMVEKVSGYRWPGVIVSRFLTQSLQLRYVVECTVPEVVGALHIYSEEQLAPLRQPQPVQRVKPAREMSGSEIAAALRVVNTRIARGFDEGSGSPGEWYYERAEELSLEQHRRGAQACTAEVQTDV